MCMNNQINYLILYQNLSHMLKHWSSKTLKGKLKCYDVLLYLSEFLKIISIKYNFRKKIKQKY